VTPRPAVRSIFVAAAVAVVLGGVAAYLVARGTRLPSAAQPAPQPAAAPPAPAVGVTPAPAPPPPVAPATSRVLVMRAHDATWVRVRPQDAPPSEEILQPGTVREWRSPGRFLVTVGNAGGVALELDGVALPPLGKTGEVVRDVTIPPEPRS
jgi:cytoskeleton protein RodZ